MTVLLVGYLLPVVAVSAALCGHVGEAWPPGVWWRAWRRRPVNAESLYAPQEPAAPLGAPEPRPRAAERHRGPRMPSVHPSKTHAQAKSEGAN